MLFLYVSYMHTRSDFESMLRDEKVQWDYKKYGVIDTGNIMICSTRNTTRIADIIKKEDLRLILCDEGIYFDEEICKIIDNATKDWTGIVTIHSEMYDNHTYKEDPFCKTLRTIKIDIPVEKSE